MNMAAQVSTPSLRPSTFDLTADATQYEIDRHRRNLFYFLAGATACLFAMFGGFLVAIEPKVAEDGISSLVGGTFVFILGLGALLIATAITTTMFQRPGAVGLRVDREGIEFRYPSGKVELRRWRDPKACVDLYTFRVNQLSYLWSHRPTGELHYAVGAPYPWSPISFIPEAARVAVESEAKVQRLYFARRPRYGGWGYMPLAITRVSANPGNPEKPLSPSSVRYLLRIQR